MTGGHYDVDVILTDPTRNVLYKQIKKQYDSHTWTAAKTGGEEVKIEDKMNCQTKGVIYVLESDKDPKQYGGQTGGTVGTRSTQHAYDIEAGLDTPRQSQDTLKLQTVGRRT